MMRSSKVLIRIVDDDLSQREALRFLLEGSGFEVADYASARDFFVNDDSSVPGIVILDYQMPEMDGLTLQKEKNARCNDLPVIFLSAHGNLKRGVQAMKQGSIDFLEKPVDEAQLLETINKALAVYLSKKKSGLTPEEAWQLLQRLTEKETRVAKLLAAGLLKPEVAEELRLGVKTIDSHAYSIYKKLGIHSAAELASIYAISRLLDNHQVP